MVNLALAPSNPMNRAMAACLGCEVIVFILAFPGMVVVSHRSVWLSTICTLVPTVLAIMGCARLRKPGGYAIGWLAIVFGVLLGLLTPLMWVAGGLFAVIWVVSFVLGRRLEERAV